MAPALGICSSDAEQNADDSRMREIKRSPTLSFSGSTRKKSFKLPVRSRPFSEQMAKQIIGAAKTRLMKSVFGKIWRKKASAKAPRCKNVRYAKRAADCAG